MDLMEKLKQANQSSHEFNFLLGQSLGAGEKLVDAKESLQRNVDELQNQAKIFSTEFNEHREKMRIMEEEMASKIEELEAEVKKLKQRCVRLTEDKAALEQEV